MTILTVVSNQLLRCWKSIIWSIYSTIIFCLFYW